MSNASAQFLVLDVLDDIVAALDTDDEDVKWMRRRSAREKLAELRELSEKAVCDVQ